MKWTPLLIGSLTAVLIAGCGRERRNNDTGTVGGAAMGSDTMQGSAAPAPADTGMRAMDTTSGAAGGMTSDTTRTGSRMHPDTNNTGGKKTSSRPGATKTRPDQGQPVNSKGDTIRSGGDSVPGSNQ